uniref:Uncharacterized protein n=1 Tax=Vitis vinifera TaxID=29760 RepID=F6GTD3_VITVI
MSQCSSSLTSYKYNNPALVLFLLFHTLLLFQHSGYLGVGSWAFILQMWNY